MKSESAGKLAEWRTAWPVVLSGAFGYGTGFALFNLSFSLFLEPMRQDLGLTARQASLAPIASIVLALSSPFVSTLVDRHGARIMLIGAQIAFLSCLMALALAPASLIYIYAVVILLGAVAPLTSVAPVTKGVASWFRRSPGAAMGITLSGVSIIALFALPLLGMVIAHHGWRLGFATLAGLILVFGLPATLLGFREKRQAVAQPQPTEPATTGMPLRLVFRDPRFWLLFCMMAASGMSLGGLLTHIFPMLREAGFDQTQAASLMTLFPVSMIVGRIGGGFLLDRFVPTIVAAVLLSSAGCGAVLLHLVTQSPTLSIAIPAMLLIGAAQGVEGDYIAFFTLRFFGLRAFATIVGIYATALALFNAIGGLSFAELFDRQGDYQMALLVGAGGFFLASFVMALTWRANRSDRPSTLVNAD